MAGGRRRLLPPAIADRRPGAAIDTDALADHLYTTFEGAFILCRTLGDSTAMAAQLRMLRQLVESFLETSASADQSSTAVQR